MKYLEYFAKNLFPKIYPRLISFMINAITKKLISMCNITKQKALACSVKSKNILKLNDMLHEYKWDTEHHGEVLYKGELKDNIPHG